MDDHQQDKGPQWKRRSFLKSSAVLGAGLFLGGGSATPSVAWAERAAPLALYGDGGLTSIAIVDDCARLARHSEGIDATIKEVLHRSVNQELPGNVALLGGMAPMGVDDAVDLLGRIRQRWEGREDGDRTEEKLALVLGWMAHRAAREHLRPLHAELEPSQPGLYPSEATLYHDAAVLRHRSGRSANGDNGQPVDPIAQLFREMGPRILIRFHTFIPDYDDGSGWVERMAAWRHEKESLLHRLAQAYQAPGAEKLRQYVTEPNFYNENDAIIRVAHALQRGEEPPLRAEQAAAAATSDQSLYAQALIQGYHYLQEASGYWRGDLSQEALLHDLSS